MTGPNEKAPFLKWREGEKRQTRFNEWYKNEEGHKDASTFFAGFPGGVPNNPENYKTFTNKDDLVFNKNPYGDSERIVQQVVPGKFKPDQSGGWNTPPAPKAGFDQQQHAGWGGTGPKGMSTGLSAFGSGPQRNIANGGGGKKPVA